MKTSMQVRVAAVQDIIGLRHRILRAGLPLETARLPGDDDSSTCHLGLWLDEDLTGCVSLMVAPLDGKPAMQLRGMAIAREAQGRHLGRHLLSEAEKVVRCAGVSLIWCNARESAREFYRKHGWKVISERFTIEHAGPHFRMSKCLEEVPVPPPGTA